jgi:hypothetical protein
MPEMNMNRILNRIPSRDTNKDWTLKHAVDAKMLDIPPKLPESVDLREDWWDVRDQTIHGSCVGCALADILRWHFVDLKMLPKDKRLSARFLWMASKEMDEFETRPTTFLELPGTSLKSALDIARKYGCVGEPTLPFDPDRMCHQDPESFFAAATRFRIRSYYNLSSDQDGWKAWLALVGPIFAGLDVDATWDNAMFPNGNLDAYLPGTMRGGHAVAIVGYTPDRFIIKNSWGTDWGDSGYGYASMEYARDAFPEAYGIIV